MILQDSLLVIFVKLVDRRLCCKNSRGGHDGREASLLLSLGCHSKQASGYSLS